MRLFVALDPPPQALAELDKAVAPLRVRWPELRWSGQDKWHVTLAFLGEVDEARLDPLAIRLERAAARHPQAVVSIGQAGAFPSATRARVLIAHIVGEPSALAGLAALAASVAAGARRAGAPPPDEGRLFRPHVTVARARRPTDLGALVAALSGLRGHAWTVTHIHLIRSHGGAQVRYETLASWPLRTPR